MNRGQLPMSLLRNINWGALDHASCGPQFVACNYTIMCVHICMLCVHRTCIYVWEQLGVVIVVWSWAPSLRLGRSIPARALLL